MKFFLKHKTPDWSEIDDDALVKSYHLKGEMDIIGEIFNRYGHLVLGVCIKYLKNEDDAQDACMQIFEKLISDMKQSWVISLKPWLYTVARNHCLILIRKKIVQQNHQDDFLSKFSEDFVNFWVEMNHIHETEQLMDRLNKAMAGLDEDQRICLDLIYYQDKSYRQIAEITGLELNQVKSCIQNGKRNLKLMLGESYEK